METLEEDLFGICPVCAAQKVIGASGRFVPVLNAIYQWGEEYTAYLRGCEA